MEESEEGKNHFGPLFYARLNPSFTKGKRKNKNEIQSGLLQKWWPFFLSILSMLNIFLRNNLKEHFLTIIKEHFIFGDKKKKHNFVFTLSTLKSTHITFFHRALFFTR